jgi:two-component system sensor histidine kinase/response regulator
VTLNPDGGRAHILVTDHDPDLCAQVRARLSPGFDVEVAMDAASTLALAKRRRPDLLLWEETIAELDDLRREPALSGVPTILLCGADDAKCDDEREPRGNDDCLMKPFSGRELIARVRTQLELARLRRETELTQTSHLDELFLGILGHDLRNPLSAITTAANLLEMRADSEKIAKPVSRILSSADRMERMISQLLDLTHLRLGRGLPLSRSPVDLAEITRAIVDEVGSARGGDIVLEAAGDCAAIGDRERLAQLVSNLVVNACQHGTSRAVAIRLDGSDRGRLRLEVVSRGKIPTETLSVLFEPRRSAERGEKRAVASGLGLGLYITRQIATAHGGTIRLESSDDDETRFIVELPR